MGGLAGWWVLGVNSTGGGSPMAEREHQHYCRFGIADEEAFHHWFGDRLYPGPLLVHLPLPGGAANAGRDAESGHGR